MLTYNFTNIGENKKMGEIKEPKKGLSRLKFGLMYNSFAQTVGSAQCGSTILALLGIIVCAVSLAVNNLVLYKSITS